MVRAEGFEGLKQDRYDQRQKAKGLDYNYLFIEVRDAAVPVAAFPRRCCGCKRPISNLQGRTRGVGQLYLTLEIKQAGKPVSQRTSQPKSQAKEMIQRHRLTDGPSIIEHRTPQIAKSSDRCLDEPIATLVSPRPLLHSSPMLMPPVRLRFIHARHTMLLSCQNYIGALDR